MQERRAGPSPCPLPEAGSAARALAEALSARILASGSATDALRLWCDEHGLSGGAIAAVCRRQRPAGAVDAAILAMLRPLPGERLCHRSVRLGRGGVVLVEADNWFLPPRLASGMVRLLAETDRPFGAVVAPLAPSRRTFLVRIPEEGGAAGGRPPRFIFEHRALIRGGDGRPLAVVHERYRAELLAFAG